MDRTCIVAILLIVLVSLVLISGCANSAVLAPATATLAPTLAQNTATMTPTATNTVTPSPTGTPTQTATPTLTPTNTLTPTSTATRTPAFTATPLPTPTIAVRYPGISLREPPDNQKRETVAITFEWDDIGLKEGDGYQVLVRRAQNPAWEKSFYAGNQRKITWGREQTLGYEDYTWTVVVVDSKGQVVSAPGGERKFFWCHPRSGCQECSACHKK